jgi:hypothetical protein
VARPKTRRDPRLQTGPYLHDGKKAQRRQCKSRVVECVDTEMQTASSYLNA